MNEPFFKSAFSYEDARFLERLLIDFLDNINNREDCTCVCGADLLTDEPCADDCEANIAKRLLARIQHNIPLPVEDKLGILVS